MFLSISGLLYLHEWEHPICTATPASSHHHIGNNILTSQTGSNNVIIVQPLRCVLKLGTWYSVMCGYTRDHWWGNPSPKYANWDCFCLVCLNWLMVSIMSYLHPFPNRRSYFSGRAQPRTSQNKANQLIQTADFGMFTLNVYFCFDSKRTETSNSRWYGQEMVF